MKKILIISTNAIGDTYISMSAIPVILSKYPDAEIFFLTNKGSEFLFEKTEVEDVFVTERQVGSLLKTLIKIQKYNFDYVFSFFPGRVNSFFLKMVNSQRKGGYLNYRKINHWADKYLDATLLNKNWKEKVRWDPNENFLSLTNLILQKFDFRSGAISKYVYNIKISKKYDDTIVVHPISKIAEKSLSEEQILNLVKFLKNEKNKVILLGDNKLTELLRNKNNEVDLIIKPNIPQLIDLVHCKLFISVDSFPLHIADAYNTNFIGLFSFTKPQSVLTHNTKSIDFNISDLRKIETKRIIKNINEVITEK